MENTATFTVPQSTWAKPTTVLAGALLFQFLFWKEHLGLNLLLYVGALIFLLPVYYPALRVSRSFQAIAAGTLFAASMMVVNNSFTSKFAVFASFLLLLGMANQPQLRMLLHAAANGVVSIIQGVQDFFYTLLRLRSQKSNWKRGWYFFKLAGIPVLALLVFHLLFSVANTRYQMVSGEVLQAVGEALEWLLPEISFGRVMLMFLGLLITAGSLFLVPFYHFRNRELAKSDNINRTKGYTDTFSSFLLSFYSRSHRLLDLKKEYVSGLLLLGLVNVLLLAVNIIDINWLWFGFEFEEGFVLAQFVHEGTYVLIFSILLAMAIVLLYFRGNLNFYRHNRLLKLGAYLWLVQNAVLVVSVGLRNYYYIYYHGLAYKRIGVVVFLLLTLFGLCTIYLKISNRKSLFYLLRTNTLAAYVMLLLLTTVNWDTEIAKTNINYPDTEMVDYDFLLSLSDKALPVLYQNQQKLDEKGKMLKYPYLELRPYLHTRIKRFMSDYERHTWRSWNYADAQAYQYFKTHYNPNSLNNQPRSLPVGHNGRIEEIVVSAAEAE